MAAAPGPFTARARRAAPGFERERAGRRPWNRCASSPACQARRRPQNAARAMAISLWSPTWGKFLENVTKLDHSGATLSDANREATRIFFRDHVRARGPLPAIRIGQQPYGVLPTSAMSDARWKTPRSDTYEGGLLPLLLASCVAPGCPAYLKSRGCRGASIWTKRSAPFWASAQSR